MLVSKDIMKWMINEHFDKETVYQFQFVSKWCKSCITADNLYLAQCAKVAKDMQDMQNGYMVKRRSKDIKCIVEREIYDLNDGRKIYLEKKLLAKYSKQIGDTRCWLCYKIDTPDSIREHMRHCKWVHRSMKCKICNTLNYDESTSPHRTLGCPIRLTNCYEMYEVDSVYFTPCRFEGPDKLVQYHYNSCKVKCNKCNEYILQKHCEKHAELCYPYEGSEDE